MKIENYSFAIVSLIILLNISLIINAQIKDPLLLEAEREFQKVIEKNLMQCPSIGDGYFFAKDGYIPNKDADGFLREKKGKTFTHLRFVKFVVVREGQTPADVENFGLLFNVEPVGLIRNGNLNDGWGEWDKKLFELHRLAKKGDSWITKPYQDAYKPLCKEIESIPDFSIVTPQENANSINEARSKTHQKLLNKAFTKCPERPNSYFLAYSGTETTFDNYQEPGNKIKYFNFIRYIEYKNVSSFLEIPSWVEESEIINDVPWLRLFGVDSPTKNGVYRFVQCNSLGKNCNLSEYKDFGDIHLGQIYNDKDNGLGNWHLRIKSNISSKYGYSDRNSIVLNKPSCSEIKEKFGY
jgi:hypothetical protein